MAGHDAEPGGKRSRVTELLQARDLEHLHRLTRRNRQHGLHYRRRRERLSPCDSHNLSDNGRRPALVRTHVESSALSRECRRDRSPGYQHRVHRNRRGRLLDPADRRLFRRSVELLVRLRHRSSIRAGDATECGACKNFSQRSSGRNLWTRSLADPVVDSGNTAHNSLRSTDFFDLCPAVCWNHEQRPNHHADKYRRNCASRHFGFRKHQFQRNR